MYFNLILEKGRFLYCKSKRIKQKKSFIYIIDIIKINISENYEGNVNFEYSLI